MTSSQTSYVQEGSYIDYGRGFMSKYQWLWSTQGAGVWTNFLGILITIACARVLKILWRLDLHAANYDAIHHPPTQGNAPKHLLFTFEGDDKEPTLEGLGWKMLTTIYKLLKRGVNVLPTNAPSINNTRGLDIILLLAGGIFLLLTYIGIIVFGILMSQLQTDSAALSASPDCGIYRPSQTDTLGSYSISRPYEFDTQLASASLAKQCYHAEDGADSCNFFLQQSIEYDTIHNASCPYPEHMCHDEKNGSIKFIASPISARALGINSPKAYEFQRTTTCSPLNMNETFIQLHKNNNEYTFSYHYGSSKSIGNGWTWRTDSYATNLGKPPSYLVGTMTASAFPWSPTEWQPIPELAPDTGTSITIIFILPQKIYYLSSSADPIFPANKKVFLRGETAPFWLYTRGHATVLACSDETNWRDASGGSTWSKMTAMPPPEADLQARGALWLFWFSILNSNSYQTISQRLGNALNASDLISGFMSLPLETEQWKVEAARIFETSLARTQIDARNIARGLMAHYQGYVRMNDTPTQMCQVYLFRAQGLVNVNIVVSLMVLVPCALTVILAFPTLGDEILLEIVLRDSAMPFGYYVICGILKIGNGVELVFRLDTWMSIGESVKGVFIGLQDAAIQLAANAPRFRHWGQKVDAVFGKISSIFMSIITGYP